MKVMTIEELNEDLAPLKNADLQIRPRYAKMLISYDNDNWEEALASINSKTLIILPEDIIKCFGEPPDFVKFSSVVDGLVILNGSGEMGTQNMFGSLKH